MAIVDVLDVSKPAYPNELLRGFDLASPLAGSSLDAYALTFDGWVVPCDGPPQGMRLDIRGRGSRAVRLNERPDVASVYPEAPWARLSGFRLSLSAAHLPPEFEIGLVADLPEHGSLPLALVRGRRGALPTATGRIQPLMLTTLPRVGGTWATHLLGQHPEVLALRPFQYEARIATYWLEVFAALAEPKSYLRCLGADLIDDSWWLGDNRLAPEPPAAPEPEFVQWLGRDNVEALLRFAQARIEGAYDEIARIQRCERAKLFVERSPSRNPVSQAMLYEMYPEAPEIVVVRDFRDMIASIFAYNRKRGLELFGRHDAKSDEEFIALYGETARWFIELYRQRSSKSYLLRYEDLILEPRQTLRSLLDYLGVESEPGTIEGMLRSAESQASLEQRVHRTTPNAQASIGRWQRDLEPELKDACATAFDELLATLGYT